MRSKKDVSSTPTIKKEEEDNTEVQNEFVHHIQYSTSVPYVSSCCKNYSSPPVKNETVSVNSTTNLNDLRKQKLLNEKKLLQIENQLFQLETTYLENSWSYGNVLKGFDSFLTNRNRISNSSNSQFKKAKRKDQDRIFTNSSFINYNDLMQDQQYMYDDGEEDELNGEIDTRSQPNDETYPVHPSSLQDG